MKQHRHGWLVAVVALVASAALWSPASAAAESSDDELADRLAMVRTLLFDSSAAKRVEASGSAEAHEMHQKAIALFEASREPGDLETRKAGLKSAVDLFYQASAAVPKSASAEEKSRRDFGRKRESLDALLDAHERIMKEKGTEKSHATLLDNVEADISAAESLLGEGKVDQASERLNRAYDVTRIAVENSRMGETLKRELKFESAEDEYRYELDRNETHRMLLTVLLKDKLGDERIKNRVDAFVESANRYRGEADKLAEGKHFDEAIAELERSTAELVKAIRGAGVYIPG